MKNKLLFPRIVLTSEIRVAICRGECFLPSTLRRTAAIHTALRKLARSNEGLNEIAAVYFRNYSLQNKDRRLLIMVYFSPIMLQFFSVNWILITLEHVSHLLPNPKR